MNATETTDETITSDILIADKLLEIAEGLFSLADLDEHVAECDLEDHVEECANMVEVLRRLVVVLEAEQFVVMETIGVWYSALTRLNDESAEEQKAARDALARAQQ